jgi:hypothetical protein
MVCTVRFQLIDVEIMLTAVSFLVPNTAKTTPKQRQNDDNTRQYPPIPATLGAT